MSELAYYELKQISGLAPSLSAHVAREIGKRIVSAAYETGDLVEDESSLALHYQVSRSVIRDAVKMLVGKGLLEARRGIGTRVRSRENWALLDNDILAWQQSNQPNMEIFRQLMDFRQIFEPKAARCAAEQGSDTAHQELKEAFERMEEEAGSVEEFVQADAMFHRAILRATHNEFLMALEGVVFSTMLSSIRLTNKDPRDNESSIPLHRKVYEAISERDGPKAELAMQNLLADANQRLNRRTLNS